MHSTSLRGVTLFAVGLFCLAGRSTLAYDQYSQNRDATNCRACHGDFRSSPYTSLVDNQSWGDDLHDVHRNTMLGGDCSTCHSASSRFPVRLDSSVGGNGLQPISCTGCHGRTQDATSGTQGSGAGLRQHHYRAGQTLCINCHTDSNPANKTVVGEDVLPPYYANPGSGHNIPTDPCNPAPGFPENFKGTTIGLDNDGDEAFDEADPDCGVAAVCGDGTVDPGEECDDGNTVGGDCCSATCRYESAGSTCDDGLFCTTGETCDGGGTCGGGAPRSCDDGVGCTVDSCNEATDACESAPNDAACDDGLFCNGAETCSATLDCQAGAAPSCDDADLCTDDTCNEGTDGCDHVFDPTNDPTCAALCTDDDLDGYSINGGVCGPIDCDDSDAAVNPDATEACANDKDDDCDGLLDAADGACAGTPWSVRAGPLTDPVYAGSPACAPCHATQYDTWSSSLHARMLVRPGDAQAAGFALPDGASVPGATVTVTSWSDVLFVVGQKWKTLYVARTGDLQPVQWNYAQGRWQTAPGGPYDCGACHTTGYDPVARFEIGGDVVPDVVGAWVEYNIGCEACHGPGAEHASAPSKDNINRIVLDWTATGEGIRTPSIRSAEVCGNCHHRNDHSSSPDPQGRSESQYNDWSASPHASSLEPTTLSTYCAKCHSPGNATADSEEHYFQYFDPTEATHAACISCHDPHRPSDARWATIQWPTGGRQDPQAHPAAIARYRGSDGNAATSDYSPFASDNRNGLCTDCHTAQPGLRSHVDASPPTVIELHPPYNFDQPFEVPHAEHIEQGNAECVSCHMPLLRTSINQGDARAHTFLPNELGIGGGVHFAQTCGQCHLDAQDCVWCHGEFAATNVNRRTDRDGQPRSDTRPLVRRAGDRSGKR